MYQRYAKLRDAKGMNDHQVSQATGIGQNTLSDWKRGLYNPKADKLMKLADLFGVTVEYFLTNDEDGD